MKRLLLVTERFWPEEFVVNDLAAEAVRRGYSVTVLTQQPSYPYGRMPCGRKNWFLSRETWEGVKVVRFKTVLGYRESLFYKLFNYIWFASYGTLVSLFIRHRFDHVLIYQTGPLTMAVPAIIYSKVRRVPLTIWTQDVWPDTVYAYGFRKTNMLSRSLDVFIRWVYQSTSAILVSCPGFKRTLSKYTSKPMVYVPNWPLTAYEHNTDEITISNQPVFLFAGNIGKVQNLENVINGYAIASRKAEFFGLLRIVGDGSALNEIKRLVADIGVRVDFPGRKLASDMVGEYDRASFLVLSLTDKPIFRLTIPSKFQMYVSVGKPILCVAEGDVKEIIETNELGVVSDAMSPESISLAFLKLASASPCEVRKWQRNLRNFFSNEYDRLKIISTILSAIEETGV
jgi:glycosyltransferase involved in cell wall biosynthesis